jgi:nucleotide-binding universal stress UspA family protein
MKQKLKTEMRSQMKMRNHIHVETSRHDRRLVWPKRGPGVRRLDRVSATAEAAKTTGPVRGEEILVPIAFTPACEYAVDVALDMARKMNCGVLLVHVADRIYGHTLLDSGVRELAEKQSVKDATEKLIDLADTKRKPDTPIRCLVKTGLPSYEILRVAETENAKWIVMARTPRNVVSRVFSGSVSGDIIDCAPCAVLIVNDFGRRMANHR